MKKPFCLLLAVCCALCLTTCAMAQVVRHSAQHTASSRQNGFFTFSTSAEAHAENSYCGGIPRQ